MQVKVKKVRENAVIPKQMTAGAAGFDLTVSAFLDNNGNVIRTDTTLLDDIHTQVVKCATGLSMEIPEGYCLKILPRSGLACKENITVINSPGLIDSDYRGEIIVTLIKHHAIGSKPSWIHIGDRVAQGVFEKIETPEFIEVDELSETDRGDGKFGSTGLSDDLHEITYCKIEENSNGKYLESLNMTDITSVKIVDNKFNIGHINNGDKLIDKYLKVEFVRESIIKEDGALNVRNTGDIIAIISGM